MIITNLKKVEITAISVLVWQVLASQRQILAKNPGTDAVIWSSFCELSVTSLF